MNEAAEEKRIAEEAEKDVGDELRRIYETEEGALPDFSSLEAPKRSWRRAGLLLAGAFLTLTIAIVAGLFLLGGPRFADSEELAMEITAESLSDDGKENPIVSGSPSRVTVQYQNVSRVPVASLSIRVNLPQAFVLDRAVPEPTSPGNTWDLGSLGAGSDGRLDLYGTFVGAVPSTEKIQAIASYRPANFSSELDLIEVTSVVLEKSTAITLTVSAPETATAGEETGISLELLNPSGDAVKDVRLELVAPSGFRTQTSEPPLAEGRFWILPRLEAHTKAVFSVTGTFSANTKGLHDMGGEVFFEREGDRFSQGRVVKSVEVTNGAVAAELLVNGSAEDQNADIGSLLRISIPFQNTSGRELTNAVIRLTLTGEGNLPVNWDGEGAHLGGGERSGTTVVWDKDGVESLAVLSKDEEGVVNATLPLFSELPENGSASMTLVATVEADATGKPSHYSLLTTPLTVQFVTAAPEPVDAVEEGP